MKKLLSVLGIGAGLAYSYYRGYWAGFESARRKYDDNKKPVEVEVDPNTNDEEEEEDNSQDDERVECIDDDCDDTFNTEQGMKIHYGRVHEDD